MSKQQIFTFSLHQDTDNQLIGELLSRKNRSSYIRRALREVELRCHLKADFDRLYESYSIVYERYMKELGIDNYVIPEKHSFRDHFNIK